jgi:hypothetical protein
VKAAGAALTPVVIGKLFGLGTAGLWAVAIRIGQFLQIILDGYVRAGAPVAGRIAETPGALRRFATAMLKQAASVAYPVTGLLFAWLPVLGIWFAQWRPAVDVARTYVLALGLLGVIQASAWPVAVALLGARTALVAELGMLGTLWFGFLALRLLGGINIAIPFAAGLSVSVGYLVLKLRKPVGTMLEPAFGKPLVLLGCTLMLVWIAGSLDIGLVWTAAVAGGPPLVGLVWILLQQWGIVTRPVPSVGSSASDGA